MEKKSDMRRTQSMKSIPSSGDKSPWTDVGLKDRTTSVSQLVARYQTSADNDAGTSVFSEVASPLPESKESHLEALMKRNEERERRVSNSLIRSKSMSSLQTGSRSIEGLKALFESIAAEQNKGNSSFRAAASRYAEDRPVVNGEVGKRKSIEEKWTTQTSVNTSVGDIKTNAKEDHVTRKVVNQTRSERRKTIGGIDFEKLAASEADEKRRSIADLRDSSFTQTKDILSVSVKAMSAIYLSKVAPKESTPSLLKPGQDQTRDSGKKVKLTKMVEDSQHRKDDLPSPPSAAHQPGPEEISGAHSLHPMPSQPSKEMLYQRRQKCELKRLLKHTHPELKMLDDVVDEELAEVLTSETVTAGETGYEGEVLSRRMIFENCGLSNRISPYPPKMHAAEGTVERCDFSKTPAVLAKPKQGPHAESVKEITEDSFRPDLNRACEEEEVIKIDVQATRRIFESQSVNTSRPNTDNKFQGKFSISGADTKAARKQSAEDDFSSIKEASAGETLFADESSGFPDSETIRTSAALFENNPFISTNIEREHTSKTQIPAEGSGAVEDCVTANVKNRTHLFESMPFDKIRHQNKDEIEMMVENIKETLIFLYGVNAIHSSGSIIEVNETMIAKKARFALLESGPEIKYDEVAEGGAQNFIVQLLPRVNLKPQITYLKEDGKGCMEATVVNVPVHQHQFSTSKDTEFKTAHVVQLVEDILNQDNSLRKGVIIQEDVNNCARVIVYSLYKYFDEEDVKGYSPPQGAEFVEPGTERADKGTESTLSGLQDQTSVVSDRPAVTVKGNVKLFKSCIEKGDLEFLRSLQAEATVEEQDVVSQDVELLHEQRDGQDCTPEWVPVDVKRLKSIFSGDQSQIQPKKNFHERPSDTIPRAFTGYNVLLEKSQSSTECNTGVMLHKQEKTSIRECGGQAQDEVCNFKVVLQESNLHLGTQDDDRVHQAELVEVVDDNDEINNLQTAIHCLQQATNEAKSLCYSSQEKTKIQDSPKEPLVSVTADSIKHSITEAGTPQANDDQKADSFPEPRCSELQSVCNFTSGHKLDNTETCQKSSTPEEALTRGQNIAQVVQSQPFVSDVVSAHCSEATSATQEEEEVVFQGKIQAALESLEKSNINVSRGDFKAAMIYRNSSQTHQEQLQNVSAQKPNIQEYTSVAEPQPPQAPNSESLNQTETLREPPISTVTTKSKGPTGPKPAIPPKPEHLNLKQIPNQSANTKNPTATASTEMVPQVPQPLPKILISCKDEHKEEKFKYNSGTDSAFDSLDERKELSVKSVQMSQEVQGSAIAVQNDKMDKKVPGEMNVPKEEKIPQDLPPKDNTNETDESHVDFHEACQKFGGKKGFSMKTPPVKPKRVRIAQPENKNSKIMSGGNDAPVLPPVDPEPAHIMSDPSHNNYGRTHDNKDKQEKEMTQEIKVELREKKGRTETEDERRQRLSVHMDEIMRGNIVAAMEIFDNLRKQEELQNILSRVEDIEQDTSEVDVTSLRRVFENVPDWVVSSDKKKQKKVRAENKDKKQQLPRESTESKSSMALVFGDLERASEEIMSLKEQTLARLMDIEEAIKKALYSVSTLKSDSDIAGLSCLFKESLGIPAPSSGNISKISIGSSRMKSEQEQESATKLGNTAQPPGQSENLVKQRASPPSSPAFISIQSAARKADKAQAPPPETSICPACQQSPKPEETFRTTKTLTCSSPAQSRRYDPRKGGQKQSTSSHLNPNPELGVLEVQGNSITGTKTVTENYERTDNLVSTTVSRDVFSLSEASLSDGKNNCRQIHFSQNMLLLQKVQEKIKHVQLHTYKR
ncbi:LIM domain-containing protein isoform X2 [Mugil cephalus]|uniref:LIM domain-containing protein isoform X2 n=1 Tax=Mugil cephalus TaxID=48193 RepID=UPI001FB686D2|nr:LIM domain-containing protein isoform X2 [Mugil cephalus]